MASIIKVETLQDTSGNNAIGMQYVSSGSCKAWIAVDQIGTQSIHGSFNISSIVDTNVGTTTLSFTNNFSTNNYVATGADHYAGNTTGVSPFVGDPDQVSTTTSSNLIQCYSTTAVRDTAYVGWHGMGDLA